MSTTTPDGKAIFNVARQIESPDVRMAYLWQVCGTDSDSLQHVTTLLRAFEEQASFWESPPLGVSGEPTNICPINEKVGTQIGPYKLLQEIGKGRMGTVFLAEQLEPVRRKVALKVIKPGMDTRQVIARFEAERQQATRPTNTSLPNGGGGSDQRGNLTHGSRVRRENRGQTVALTAAIYIQSTY